MGDDRPGPDPERRLRQARAGDESAREQLLQMYRSYLNLLGRLQVGRRLWAKADASDAVQEALLKAHRHFEQSRGTTEAELVDWLRQILATTVANLLRRHYATARRNARLERELRDELDRSFRAVVHAVAGAWRTAISAA